MARRTTRQAPTAFTSAAPPANFTVTTEERVRALSIGVPAFAERKRRIEANLPVDPRTSAYLLYRKP